jgi:hypothetical protein
MEVHHHTHSKRKKWTHYFWEFLMLFLAVFCGFLAENFREHQVEHKREKQYMASMLEDLKADTATYSNYAKTNAEIYTFIDSLIPLIKSNERKIHVNRIYFLARMITIKLLLHFPTIRTYDQMKNSGQLRIIRNIRIADSIGSYYNSLAVLAAFNDLILAKNYDYQRAAAKIFDAEVLLSILKERKEPSSTSVKLLTEDPLIINELLTNAQYLYGSLLIGQNICTQRQHTAENLITLITDKYHLE